MIHPRIRSQIESTARATNDVSARAQPTRGGPILAKQRLAKIAVGSIKSISCVQVQHTYSMSYAVRWWRRDGCPSSCPVLRETSCGRRRPAGPARRRWHHPTWKSVVSSVLIHALLASRDVVDISPLVIFSVTSSRSFASAFSRHLVRETNCATDKDIAVLGLL